MAKGLTLAKLQACAHGKLLKAFLKTLVEHFGGKRIREITHEDIERFKLARLRLPTRRGTQRTIASVNRELELMRAVLRYASR